MHDLHSDLTFLPERMKINKCSKPVCYFMTKRLCCLRKSFKTSTKSWSHIKKVHGVIQFNQEAWLKPYIDMNNKFRKEAKNDFQKDFFKLMNNSVFGKTMENMRKHKDIKLVRADKTRNQLVSEPNYHTTKWFSEDLLAMEINKIKVKMNKAVYLGSPILQIK